MEQQLNSILSFIESRNKNTAVDIRKIPLSECSPWYYDEQTGTIHNLDFSFFEIAGCIYSTPNKTISQPILIQNEIGYLGMLCRKGNDGLEFLMQAKIEPGNINCIQISPTIQATKSNFTQQHGGRKPAYLDYFINADSSHIIVDQIQSEQSSRFFAKRNRNIVVLLDKNTHVEVLPTHMWMTLREIKALMQYDNLVNMDTRTVLSCLPYSITEELVCGDIEDALINSICKKPDFSDIVALYHTINNKKMFSEGVFRKEKLFSLKNWHMTDNGFECDTAYPFRVVFCDISIEGREVKQWRQPLFEATGRALFGLLYHDFDGVRKFLIRITEEIGCFDKAELGPTVQREADSINEQDNISQLFFSKYERQKDIKFDSLLSEEGGRFYHEENRNVIIELNDSELPELNENYRWCDYATLNALTQINNCLNIQLRNLLSILEIY